MNTGCSQLSGKHKGISMVRGFYNFLAGRAYSVIMLGALFCTLAAKFLHSWRTGLIREYFSWILADISTLLLIELILALICFWWRRRWVFRVVTFVAALVCTWSVMNAGWLIRTGTQILPMVLLPLIRDPLNSLAMVTINMIRMPKAAVMLLGPSAIALGFFFSVMARPKLAAYHYRRFFSRVVISVVVILGAAMARGAVVSRESSDIGSIGLQYNCQLRAITSLALSDYRRPLNPERMIVAYDQLNIPLRPQQTSQNVVIVVLEGVQYSYTSLGDRQSNLTPHLLTLAEQGVEFSNVRATVAHTTKALFGMLTGRFPSVSQDIAEAVPVVKPYASIATIVKQQLNFRTAFFQSAKGNFECRPGLVYNLGFDKFWSRDDLGDPNSFLGYLSCDEFSMLEPVIEWIKADDKPFLLTILCSVTHDPYEIPAWYGELAKDPVERYRQVIAYTDRFLAALDVELAKLKLIDRTILCVIGDHGEAFGEHGLFSHERIGFEEVLHVPWVVRAPYFIEPSTKVAEPLSSVDLTPTLLGLLGFEVAGGEFDGINALGQVPGGRKVYFSGWMQPGPAGFVIGSRKYIYNPMNKLVSAYDLGTDPLELVSLDLPEQKAKKVAEEVVAWRQNSIFRINQQRTGKKVLFGRWLCRWTNRVSSAKYQKEDKSKKTQKEGD